MAHYTSAIVKSTVKPSQIDTLYLKYKIYLRIKYLTILDHGKAYHQIDLSPESRPYSFHHSMNFHKWVRVQFGLMKTPAVFQRFMEQSFQDDKGRFIVPYPDDVLKISPTDPMKVKKIWC